VIIDLSFLHRFFVENLNRRLKFLLQYPTNPQETFYNCTDIFKAIKDKDHMVMHPYESFVVVLNFVKQSVNDREILTIKQTLYRVSGNSSIITALMKAVEN
jgi:polyphosphate kinase